MRWIFVERILFVERPLRSTFDSIITSRLSPISFRRLGRPAGLSLSLLPKLTCMTDSNFQIDRANIDNQPAIDARVAEVPESDREAFQLALGYLYLHDGPTTIPRDGKAAAEKHLNEVERFTFNWLFKRTNGKLKRFYGAPALNAVKKSEYRCVKCGFSDLRALHIEETEFDEETQTQNFECVCANCNIIAAREKEMSHLALNKKQEAETATAEQIGGDATETA